MTIVTLSELVAGVTVAEAEAAELSVATTLGLTTTAWQPLGMARTILAVNANLISTYSETVGFIAQGGYLSYAALMTTADGVPVTTWMDLVSTQVYNVQRVEAAFASGSVLVDNSSGTIYSYTPGQLHFQNANGATYSNTGSGSIAASSTGNSIAIEADLAGPTGSAAAGQTLTILTPLSGVTAQPLATSLVGTPAETNPALLLRCQAKLQSLSPNGAAGAYRYVATSIPQAAVASITPPYAVTAPITRVTVILNTGSGVVQVYIANAAGAPPAGDVAAVNAAIQALVVPDAVSAQVIAATTATVDFAMTVYVPATLSLTATQVIDRIESAIDVYFSNSPIGGVTTSAPNIVPINELIDVIINANPGTVDLALTTPTGNVSIGQSAVPIRGTTSIAVVQV